MFEAAIGTAIGFIFLFSYLGFKKVAGYAWIVDIAIFAICVYIFHGTYAGMMTGIIASVCISLFLKSIRKTVGYEKVKFTRFKGDLLPKARWENVQ